LGAQRAVRTTARDQNARLTLLTVVPDVTSVAVGPIDLEGAYEDAQRSARDSIPNEISVTVLFQHGRPASLISAAAEDHDLVVMGTHGRGRLGEALACSVSRAVVHSLHGAVLLARAPAPAATPAGPKSH
jgi:nucleotide-binding universal stress UspA family protein